MLSSPGGTASGSLDMIMTLSQCPPFQHWWGKSVPMLLQSHHKKGPAVDVGWRLFNAILSMAGTEALKPVGMQIYVSDEAKAGSSWLFLVHS